MNVLKSRNRFLTRWCIQGETQMPVYELPQTQRLAMLVPRTVQRYHNCFQLHSRTHDTGKPAMRNDNNKLGCASWSGQLEIIHRCKHAPAVTEPWQRTHNSIACSNIDVGRSGKSVNGHQQARRSVTCCNFAWIAHTKQQQFCICDDAMFLQKTAKGELQKHDAITRRARERGTSHVP